MIIAGPENEIDEQDALEDMADGKRIRRACPAADLHRAVAQVAAEHARLRLEQGQIARAS